MKAQLERLRGGPKMTVKGMQSRGKELEKKQLQPLIDKYVAQGLNKIQASRKAYKELYGFSPKKLGKVLG